MIKVLIVDDDNLVRRGLTVAMPWNTYGMEVVGEAANGEKALEFLQENAIDLLITDLAMPVMSGIELIRMVRERYPEVAFAVLTLHQDFEYVQEALRLGAIDYIAKVELEKQQFGDILQRIQQRLSSEEGRGKRNKPEVDAGEPVPNEMAYALVTREDRPVEQAVTDRLDAGWQKDISGQIFIWTGPSEPAAVSLNDPLEKVLQSVCIAQVKGVSVAHLLQGLQTYKKRDLFYDMNDRNDITIQLNWLEWQTEKNEQADDTYSEVKKRLQSFQWIYDERSFNEACDQLKALRLPIAKLLQLLYGLTVDWNAFFKTQAYVKIGMPDSFTRWSEVQGWLKSFREQAVAFSGSYQLNPEVSGSIISAVNIVHTELASPLFAIDVAKRVNLSRSYFNQCFKEIVGDSFNEYLRKVRMDKAREYLERTNRPIAWIAEHTGYTDEKYFSRIFREQTGMLPSEYRGQYKPR